MRVLKIALPLVVALVFTGCATTGQDWSSDTPSVNKSTKAKRAPKVNIDKESVDALSAPYSDLWDRIRDGFELEVADDPLVIKHVRWYADRPDYVDRMMSRSSRYLFYIVEEVERRKMPMELALLPFIESASIPELFLEPRLRACGNSCQRLVKTLS